MPAFARGVLDARPDLDGRAAVAHGEAMTSKLPLSVPQRLKMTFPERTAWLRENRKINTPDITHDMWRAFWRREMEMDCPDCKQSQPAGNYCWRCGLPMFAAEWYNRRERRIAQRTPEDIARNAVMAARLRGLRKPNSARRRAARA